MRLIAPPLPVVTAILLLSSASAGAAIRRARAVPAAWASEPGGPVHVTPAPFPAYAPIPDPPLAPARDSPPAPSNPEVDRWTSVLARDPETVAALGRLPEYAGLIREALEDEQIPIDFAALPIIESALLPRATSRAGAAGMWQLMPATARALGLEVSTWVDERRDPVRSSRAAARHLRDLHAEFGSWHLAAAAYNCGSARLRRAIGGARGDTAYWNHRGRLPAETRAYVPKLLAAVQILRAGGLPPRGPDAGTTLRFAEVPVAGGIHLSTVAATYGFTEDTLARLNPHLVRRTTPPGRTWPVRIPVR